MPDQLQISAPGANATVGWNTLVTITYNVSAAGSIAATCGDSKGGPVTVGAGGGTVTCTLAHTADHLNATITATFTPNAGAATSVEVAGVSFVKNPPGGGIGGGGGE